MTDVPEIVERVARTLFAINEASVTGPKLSPDAMPSCGPARWLGKPLWHQFIPAAEAAIAAHEAALAAAGLVIVPREPDGKLVSAGLEAFERRTPNGYDGPITLRIAQAYMAMVNAAPGKQP